MATGGQQEATCGIVHDRILRLETKAGRFPDFHGFVLMKEKLLVTDWEVCNLQIYNRQDGRRISVSNRLEDKPLDVCVVSDTEVVVCLHNGTIVVLSIESIKNVKRVKTIDLWRTGFDFECHSVVKWNSNKIIVSGRNYTDFMLCWCVVSVEQEKLESTHNICKVGVFGWTDLAVKDETLYVSCSTGDSNTQGVYFFNVLNPNKPNFVYRQQELIYPTSVMVDMFYVYVSGRYTIHQLTFRGQLVKIHKMSSNVRRMFYDDRQGDLYTTRPDSNEITIFKIKYPQLTSAGIPMEILRMDPRSIQLFKEALESGKETVYSIRIMVVGALAAGKSTLVKRLLGEYVKISDRSATEGIDVYTNCCAVSLSTHEWTRRSKDSEQDYKLQRLVKVLNENYQTSGTVVNSKPDLSSNQWEITEGNPMTHVADDAKNIELQEPNMDQTPASASSLQGEVSSTLVHLIPELKIIENSTTENDKIDPLGEMLKLLQQNPEKAKQDIAKCVHLTMLDFAGQYAFYTTHQMFLSHRAIYLLVADSSKDVFELVADDSYFDSQGKQKCSALGLLDIWMNSIHSCALPDTGLNSANSQVSSYKSTPPPVILVGTHIDQIPQNRQGIVRNVVHGIRQFVSPVKFQRDYCRKQGQKYLKKIRESLKDKPTNVHLVDEDFAIDNSVVDSELEKLKEKILEVASQSPYWGEQIPTRWFLLMRLKDAGLKVISRITVEELNRGGTVQIKQNDEMELFLKYLHENGTIIYFSIEVLRDNIVLDPKWLIDALKTLINAQPHLPTNSADDDDESGNLAIIAAQNDLAQKWTDFNGKGILTLDIVDAIWTKRKHPELHAHKIHILMLMEQLNIIAKPRSFNEMGVKVESYFLTPCMLRQEFPAYVICPEQDSSRVTTPEMSCIFTGKYLPVPIFHRLIAACVTRWPVAKRDSENLIFCGCCVFDLDLFHRLTVCIKSHVVCAKISRLVIDEIKTPDAKLCSKVRRFITQNLDKITSYLGQNLQYDLQASYQTWHADEGHDHDAPITPEHMNHSRLCAALVTVCGNAMREILHTNVPAPHTDINQAILANRSVLTSKQGRALLNNNQIQLVFPDPQGNTIGNVDHFDISLLYILIRNITTVSPPKNTGWGIDPQEQPRDQSVGANIERIRSYRNLIVGHSVDGKINQQEFFDYWKKIEDVIDDIAQVLGKQEYKNQLEILKKQVISVFEAC